MGSEAALRPGDSERNERMSDQPRAAHRSWRAGRKVGRTIYAMVGDTPSDDDELIGMMDTQEIALAAVYAHNRVLREIDDSSDSGEGQAPRPVVALPADSGTSVSGATPADPGDRVGPVTP